MTYTKASGADGGTHVAAAPLTTEATKEIVPDLLTSAIDRRITRIRPASTPLDQISRLGGSRHCNSMKVDFYSVDTKKTESRLAADCDPEDSTIPQGDGSRMLRITVEDPTIFDVSETILFPGVKDRDGKADMVAYVMDTGEAGEIIVLPAAEAPDAVIPKGTPVVRMGRAATELDVQTAQFQALPTKAFNFCQIFKMQVEQSTLQKLASKEVAWTLNDQEEAAVIDMRLGMEKSFLFGTRTSFTNTRKGEDVYLTGGIWNQATETFEYDVNNLTHETIVEICARAFTGNGGSKKRILLAGTGLVTALSNLNFNKSVDMRDPHVKWGIVAREIFTNFGQLYLVTSEIFDQCGHKNDGFIIDPAYISKYVHIPFHAEKLDLRASGQRNTDAVVLTEASCLVLRYPKCHLRLVNKNN
ncbi:MAG: DUF5309 domain-containing protein [Muribaculaceae bacterium]